MWVGVKLRNSQTSDLTKGVALVDSMQVTVASRMPLANAILFVLVLRQMVILHLSGSYSR